MLNQILVSRELASISHATVWINSIERFKAPRGSIMLQHGNWLEC